MTETLDNTLDNIDGNELGEATAERPEQGKPPVGQEELEPSASSEHSAEELLLLGPLWILAMFSDDLSPEVERRVAKFKRFQKPPEASYEIMRTALHEDAELRQSVLETIESDDPVVMKKMLEQLDARGKELAKAAKSADGPAHTAQELLVEQFTDMLKLWLSRPEGWRTELDRLLALHTELRLYDVSLTQHKQELDQLKGSPKKDQAKQDKTRKKAEQAKSQLHKEQLEKQLLERQIREQAQELEEAREQILHSKSEVEELASLRRQCDKLQKDLTKRQLHISKLEKELRKLRNAAKPETEAKPVVRRTGYKRKDHVKLDPAQLEPRQPIVLPMGTNSLSESAAHYYMRQAAVVIVDGYNFIFCGWQQETENLTYKGKNRQPMPDPSKSPGLEVYRNRLIDNCARVFAAHKRYALEHFSIIFDSSFPNLAMSSPPASGVDVLFTQRTTDADSEIVDRIRQYPNNKPVVVVTDDMELRIRCKALGATIMSVTQLLRIFGPTHR